MADERHPKFVDCQYRGRSVTRGFSAVILLGAALGCATPGVALADTPPSLTAGCPSEPGLASAHATVPAELVVLEQKMKHLRLSSIRLSYHMTVATPKGKLILNDLTETRRSPSELMSTVTLEELNSSGKSSSETHKVLEIGDVTYEYQPALTRGDGGRPWVRKPRKRSNSGSSSASLEPSIKLLDSAESVIEAEPGNIEGQQVSQFTATFAPGVYPQSDLPLGELLAKECQEPVQLNLAIAPSGLPVRVNVRANYLKSGQTIATSSTTQVLASNFRFSALKPPPAKQTISAGAFRRFESARLSKELEKSKKHRGGKGHTKRG